MCGIDAVIDVADATPILLEGLKRLEYRGYDSAGMAMLKDGKIGFRKITGKIAALEKLLEDSPIHGTMGIAHTRWATHGEPSDINAHPHISSGGRVAVVHNGIIENHRELRQELEAEGKNFLSSTDTEVIPNLIERELERGANNLEDAVAGAVRQMEGAYALAVISPDYPDELIGVKQDSPLLVGINGGALYLSSDKEALVGYADHTIDMKDGDIVVLHRGGRYVFRDRDEREIESRKEVLDTRPEDVSKGSEKHWMRKEILEQPHSIRTAIRNLGPNGEVRFGGLEKFEQRIANCRRIVFVACGTSLYAAQAGKLVIESLPRITTEAEHASEFQYRDPILGYQDVVIGVSQSGETADTLKSMRIAKKSGALALGIVNKVGSTLAREDDGGIYLHAGPEKGVASTKAFTSQVVVLTLLALRLAHVRGVGDPAHLARVAQGLRELPQKIEEALKVENQIIDIARSYKRAKSIFCLGRGFAVPVAYEGALKLKEIGYISTEGYPGGELKHGPLALIEKRVPVIAIVYRDKSRIEEKMISNLEEVRTRGGKITAITIGTIDLPKGLATHVIQLPEVPPELVPVIAAIPLQLLAYHLGLVRGNDVDQPRNLAKSVTVE